MREHSDSRPRSAHDSPDRVEQPTFRFRYESVHPRQAQTLLQDVWLKFVQPRVGKPHGLSLGHSYAQPCRFVVCRDREGAKNELAEKTHGGLRWEWSQFSRLAARGESIP